MKLTIVTTMHSTRSATFHLVFITVSFAINRSHSCNRRVSILFHTRSIVRTRVFSSPLEACLLLSFFLSFPCPLLSLGHTDCRVTFSMLAREIARGRSTFERSRLSKIGALQPRRSLDLARFISPYVRGI